LNFNVGKLAAGLPDALLREQMRSRRAARLAGRGARGCAAWNARGRGDLKTSDEPRGDALFGLNRGQDLLLRILF